MTETLAFKPYPCGTMTHPYIDCARRLAARGVKADDIVEMVCEVGEGTVHRLWEPLAAKQQPANGYAGKFSTPYCIAAGFVRGNVGLGDFTDAAVRDPQVVALAGKVRYRIDPKIPIRRISPATFAPRCADGSVVEERQPYMRGGAQEPLTRADIEAKVLAQRQARRLERRAGGGRAEAAWHFIRRARWACAAARIGVSFPLTERPRFCNIRCLVHCGPRPDGGAKCARASVERREAARPKQAVLARECSCARRARSASEW